MTKLADCGGRHVVHRYAQNALSDVLRFSLAKTTVFSERCELKKVPPDTAEYVICRRHHLLSNIRKDLDRFDPIFDVATFEELKASLAALAEGSTQTARTQHVEEAQKVASGGVCPWCGSELVRRNGKYGPFMGCSSYPKCRFTRNA